MRKPEVKINFNVKRIWNYSWAEWRYIFLISYLYETLWKFKILPKFFTAIVAIWLWWQFYDKLFSLKTLFNFILIFERAWMADELLKYQLMSWIAVSSKKFSCLNQLFIKSFSFSIKRSLSWVLWSDITSFF